MSLNDWDHEKDVDHLELITPKNRNFQMWVNPFEKNIADEGYEDLSSDLVKNLAPQFQLFIDVGARHGYYSLLVSKANPNCSVIAFEPVQNNCMVIKKNLAQNDVSTVELISQAVSDHDGITKINLSHNSTQVGVDDLAYEDTRGQIEVQVCTLGKYLENCTNNEVFIRVDSGGHELAVINGIKNILQDRSNIRLLINLNPDKLKSFQTNPGDVLRILQSLGYDIYFVDDWARRVYRPTNAGIDDWQSIIDEHSHANLLCIPKNRSLNLMFFSHTPNMGGAERSLLELITELIRDRGAICTVALWPGGKLEEMLREVGAAIIHVEFPWWCTQENVPEEATIKQKYNQIFEWLLNQKPVLSTINPDVVITNTSVHPWGALLAYMLNRPHVWMAQEFGPQDQALKYYMPYQQVLDFITRSSNYILTNSSALKNSLFANRAPDEKVIVHRKHIEIAADDLQPDSSLVFSRKNALRMVITGVISEQKGQEDAIFAVRELVNNRGRDVELKIIGWSRPSYLKQLKHIVDTARLSDHIQFENYHPKILSLVNQADVVLVCSRMEAFGRMTLEGMLLGKPIIGTNTGGTPELVQDGVNGFLYTPGDYRSLADKIEQFIIHPEIQQDMGAAGLHYANQNHTADAYGGRAYNLFLELRNAQNARNEMVAQFYSDLVESYAQLTSNRLEENRLQIQSMIFQRDQLTEQIHGYKWQLIAKENSIKSLQRDLHREESLHKAVADDLWKIYCSSPWKLYQKLLPDGSFRVRIAKSLLSPFRRIVHSDNGFVRQFKDQDTPDTYSQWIKSNEPDEDKVNDQITLSENFPYRPTISIVTPVYKTPVSALRDMLTSVVAQTYGKWELCVSNGSPEVGEITQVLEEFARKDSRIKITQLQENLGIAGNTNAAIDLARGDYVAFLDHDDTLAPFALYELVTALNNDRESDLLYSDEDKLSADGTRRESPFFKPAYNPDLLRSVNYMTHFLVLRKTLGDQIGWLRDGFNGAQDYDLILRATEKAKLVTHIPQVLYHWRMLESSTASVTDAKEYATAAGIKALSEHLKRLNIAGEVVQGYAPTTYQIRYSLTDKPRVSIIIPNHNHADDLQRCLTSIISKTSYSNYEILIVENHSTEESTFNLYKELAQTPKVRVVEYNLPFNFQKINNYAVHQTSGEVVLFLNNDTEVINRDWLERMVEHVMRPEVGVVGAKLYYPDNTIQHAGVILGIGGIAGHSHKHLDRTSTGYFGRVMLVSDYSSVTGACLMMRKDVFTQVGGFDESYPLAFGDVDLCVKTHAAGFLIVVTPYAELFHYESKTRGYEDTHEKVARFNAEVSIFKMKWGKILMDGDPAYNPNLSLDHEDFRIDPGKKELHSYTTQVIHDAHKPRKHNSYTESYSHS